MCSPLGWMEVQENSPVGHRYTDDEQTAEAAATQDHG